MSGPVSLNENVLTITGAGEVSIRATQSGNAEYAPATQLIDRLLSQKHHRQLLLILYQLKHSEIHHSRFLQRRELLLVLSPMNHLTQQWQLLMETR